MTRGPIAFISLKLTAPYRTLAQFAVEPRAKTIAHRTCQTRLLGLPARTPVLSPGESITSALNDHFDDAA
jgi:hypothetical protein